MTDVILIYDIGKTNKKAFLIDQSYAIVWEKSVFFDETSDEDGDPCEDLPRLTFWLKSVFSEVSGLNEFTVKAINFSSYGASLVFLDGNGKVISPLYNYLKSYPEALITAFYEQYGGEAEFSRTTASPVLGSLNSGMLIYRMKHDKKAVFPYVKRILHLPNYLSFLFSGKKVTDLTSVGCHTNLWDYTQSKYHAWLEKEDVLRYLAPVHVASDPFVLENGIAVGTGLHDSSSALIPYLKAFEEPFLLLSTGTWSISINPFNKNSLSQDELANDCLCYLRADGQAIKASRLLSGLFHEQQSERIAQHFNVETKLLFGMAYDPSISVKAIDLNGYTVQNPLEGFERVIDQNTAEEAYHQLIADLVALQKLSTDWVLKDTDVKKIFVDGGFGNNDIFMRMLADAYPDLEVYTSEVPQASALGAALIIHEHWNKEEVPSDLIRLKRIESSGIK
jgi:L-fuculokinase